MPKKITIGVAVLAIGFAVMPGYDLVQEWKELRFSEGSQMNQVAAIASFSAVGLARDSKSYGSDPNQTIDVMYRSGLKLAPIIVLVHGGGFVDGSSKDMADFATFFANSGYVTASINYRLASKTGDGLNGFPVPVNDVACSVAWVKSNAARYGGNPLKVVIMGHSAGANLAAMVAFNPTQQYLDGCKIKDQNLTTVAYVGSSGPYDFNLVRKERWEPGCYLQKYLGLSACAAGNSSWKTVSKSKLQEVSPITYVSSGDPASLIISGNKDCFLNTSDLLGRCVANSTAMATALKKAGVANELKIISGFDHGLFVKTFSATPSSQKLLSDFLSSKIR